MPTYTNPGESSSLCPLVSCLCCSVFSSVFAVCVTTCVVASGEEYAKPPEWTDKQKSVFFEDARLMLSGPPPTDNHDSAVSPVNDNNKHSNEEVWRELISAVAIESAVKASVNRVARSARQPARFKAGLHNECRRDLTLLGTLFKVIDRYPGDVRWKDAARGLSQVCLHVAESCAQGTDQSLEQVNDALIGLEGLLRGQTDSVSEPAAEALIPEFAPLMQALELFTNDELAEALSAPSQFRKQAEAVDQKAQVLAMLSEFIRGEAYGYADDQAYLAHADKLRDAAGHLGEAAKAMDFRAAVQAAAAAEKACADCHAEFRG